MAFQETTLQETKHSTEVWKNFIVLEGIDGAGTTTQLKALEQFLVSKGHSVSTTCEPTPLETGKLCRRILSGELDYTPETLAHLFVTDRQEHLYGKGGIRELLDAGNLVITDRYLFSSLAYQSLGASFDFVYSLNAHFPLPEHIIFLDAPVHIAAERRKGREAEEIFEKDSLQARVIKNYNQGFKIYSDIESRLHRIDGTLKPGEIRNEILKKIGLWVSS